LFTYDITTAGIATNESEKPDATEEKKQSLHRELTGSENRDPLAQKPDENTGDFIDL
jgi:hypothetical protein